MSSQKCYASNGTVLPAYGSCSSANGNSVCCAAGQTCLSNGLCLTSSGGLYNGGCTDSTYTSPPCHSFCLSGKSSTPPQVPNLALTTTPGTDHFIVSCPSTSTSNQDKPYCCSGDGSLDYCNTPTSRLPLPPGTSTAAAAFVIPVTLSSTLSTTPSPTTTTLPPQSQPTLPATTSTTTPANTHPSPSSTRLPPGVIAAIALPLLFCTTALLIYIAVIRRQRRRHRTPRPTPASITEVHTPVTAAPFEMSTDKLGYEPSVDLVELPGEGGGRRV